MAAEVLAVVMDRGGGCSKCDDLEYIQFGCHGKNAITRDGRKETSILFLFLFL
jgi:hypothetical protein